MKLKYFFIALVAMVACFSEAFAQQVITVSNAEELKQALKEAGAAPQARLAAQGGAPTYTGLTVTLDQYEDASLIDGYFDLKPALILDLNGYVVNGNITIEKGQLSIIDNKGTGAWIGCITVDADATLAVGSGNVIAGESGVAVINNGTLSTDGGAVIGKITNTGSITGVPTYNTALVANTTVAQAALNAAIDGQVIQFASNIEGDLTAVQKPNTKITIDGKGKTLKGTITVDGKSYAYETTGVTIKNLNFDATGISKDASINLGDGSDATRYTSNVTINACTFKNGGNAKAAVKSYQGGCKNLVITDCKAEGMHSLLQATNITGITITGCKATTKNGINLNSSSNVKIEKNTIEVEGYAVRAGVSGGTSGKIELTNNTLQSDNADGDAVVVLRGTAPAQADLSMTENVVLADTHISGTTANTKISAEANYWNGKENPVVAGGSAPVVVNSYYADKEKSDLQRNEMGSIYAFVMADRIFGDVTTNAKDSLVINVYGKNGSQIGTCTAEKAENLTAKPKTLTWRMNFGADDSDSWKMEWANGAPSIDNMPAKVQVVVDGVALGEAEVKLTQNGDGQNPVFAAKTTAEGKIRSYIVSEGFGFSKAAATLVSAAAEDDNIAILKEGTYTVPTGKNLTITGKVAGVKFDNIGACNMGGANVTFDNVTFDYYPNVNYTGLQHSGNLVYNNCTIDGQVFLYGASETFNECTFNQNSSDAYNVWTYGAAKVAFNKCTFNSAGKSVLIYSDQAGTFNDVAVAECTFNASTPVEGKAAIEMDSQISSGINLTIDAATTATGFGTGNVSGNSLWNNKKGNDNNANNDITVTVDGKPVLAPTYEAKIGETGHRTLQEAINAVKNGETITLVGNIADDVTLTEKAGLYYTIDGAGKTMNGKMTITPLSDENNNRRITIKNIKFENTADAARDFISCVKTNHYPRLTVEDCTFTGNGKQTDVALRLKTAYGAVIRNCTATGMHSFLQNTAGKDLTIENVKVTESKSAFALGTVQGVTVKGCEANVAGYGIRLDANTYNNNAVIESNNIKAFIPVVVRDANTESNITFNGTNTMFANNTDSIWCAIGTSEYEKNGEMPTAATGKVKVALNDKGLDNKGIYGNFGVASIGTVSYPTLAEALAAAKNNETVTLNWSEGDAPIAMNGSVFGKNVTIKGTAKVDWSKGFLFVGRGGEGDATVTFDEANLTSASNNASTGIHVSGREKETNNKYDGTVVIKNSTIELDYLINKGAMTLDKATLTVKNGFATGGRPASETENGQDATATISLTNESKLVVNNHNGMGLGYEAIGVMNIDKTSTFETTQSFLVTAKGTMNIAGKATVAGTLTNNGAITLTDAAATLKSNEVKNIATNVADHKLVYADGAYKVVAKKYVASIDENRKFESFAEALEVVQNGETITLVEGAEGKESGEISFDKDITFTITGKAPKYALPVITFQNAKVNIKDAEVLIPELDARQNAVINIVNSTVHDAGGNSIAKSYYNGAINIDKTSTVHMMQVTTMGYINIAGTLNATWQTNVYGNGMISLTEGATFNTAALHLTGKDYSGRDNTDTVRVGKPATIVVDGANFTVGKVTSNNGADYSYNSSKGINVGTVDGKQALLDVKNGGAVNFYMANGQTTNFGAGATVNVASSTLKTICRDENGTVTLANNGAVYVTGNSQLDVKKYSGNAIKIENANLADSYFAGAVNAFATNNISGTTEIGGILSVGYSGSPAEQVVVNITGNFKGTNVLVGSSNESVLNLGVAESSRTTAHFGQLGAFGDVNVANADVTYGYAFIRNDFNAINSTFAIKGGVNTYFAGNAKVVLDNTTWSLPGYANIGSYGGYMYGNADVTLKNGSSMTATSLGIEVDGEKVVKLTLEDTSSLTATKLTNQGSIVLASVDATLISNEVGNVTTSVADHMVEYTDGTYKAVSASVKIGSTYYKTLQAAVNAVKNGETITLIRDVEASEVFLLDKSVTINGEGHKVTSSATRVFRVTTSNTEVTLNGVNMVSTAVRVGTNDVRGISIDAGLQNVQMTLNNCSVDFTDASACDWAYAVNVSGNGTGHKVTVNGGSYEGANVINVHGANNTIVVKDATLTSTYPNSDNINHYGACIWVLQNQGSTVVAEGNTFNGNNAVAFNLGTGTELTASNNTDNTKLFITGQGTEDKPYLIKTAGQLVDFRNSVNAGETKYSAPGVYVALAADIDIAGENWIGIGSATADHGFMGNFDGKGFKIKNLTIENPALDADGYAYAGLFGVTEGTDKDNQNYIKNLIIENVTINTTGKIAAAAIAYPYYTIIDSVKVCGDIKIQGGDYTAGVLAYTRRCVNASNVAVSGEAGSYITGAQVVGGVISDIQMNGGLTADYKNFSAEGVTVTGTKNVGGISGIIATQTLNGATVKNVTLNCSDARVGIVSGSWGDVSTISNVIYENVTGATAIVGATYKEGNAVEAKIGDTYYATLRKAVEAAKSGETVQLLKNVTLEGGYDDAEEGLRIEKAINIAGWGHTIDCANFKKGIRVYNNGTTVNKVQFTSVTIVNNVVNGRCIDTRSANLHLHLSQANLIATNGNSQPLTIGGNDATHKVEMFGTTIDAGNSGYGVICFVPVTNGISASSSNINGFAAFYIKHDASEFTLNIGSETYTGSNMHSAESGFFGTVVVEGKDNKINVVGNGAIIKAVAGNDATQASQAAFLIRGAGNTINFQNSAAQIVTEGANAYEVAVKSDIAASTKLIKGGKEQTLVAETKGYQFYSLEEAVRFAGNEGTTKVVSDIELAQTLTIAAGDTKTLDLNGKTISANIAEQLTKSFAAICNKGTLTVKDSTAAGKISVSYAGNTFGYGMGLYTISNEGGVLNIEGGTIENLCTVSGSMYDAIDNNSTLGETVLNISGGSVVCDKYIGIRQFANSTTANNVVKISGGNIKGGNTSIWMQNPNSKANKATLTITGADYENENYPTIEGRLLAGESAGFVFDVKGGLFDTDVNDFCAPDYISYDFGDGTWGVEYTIIESLDIVDGTLTEFVNEKEKTVRTLTYTRTFGVDYQGVWMALYVPFEIPVSKLTDMGYEVAYFNDFRETLNADGEIIEGKSVIEMVKIKRGTLKANYPYAIKAPKMNPEVPVTLELVLNDVKLYSTTGERETVECSSATKRFTFSGTYKKGTKSDIVGSNDIPFYALYETGMSAMGETAKLGAFRVYMTITMKNGEPYIADNSGQAAHARAIPLRVIGEEDENGATIIYDVVEDNLNGNDFIYDLQGRRVSEPKKGGIYIKNGKKILY